MGALGHVQLALLVRSYSAKTAHSVILNVGPQGRSEG